MRRRPVPKRVWMVIDPKAELGCDLFFGHYAKKSEAQTHCDHLNRIPGYEPTCVVVRYRLDERRTPRATNKER